MGFCREMRLERTPEKGTGGSGEGRGERTLWAVRESFELAANSKFPCPRSRTQAPKPCRRPLENQKRTTVFKTLHFENDSPFTKSNIRS